MTTTGCGVEKTEFKIGSSGSKAKFHQVTMLSVALQVIFHDDFACPEESYLD